MIPLRFVFRSRWAALAWSIGICVSALRIAGHSPQPPVDAANSADGTVAQASALLAEDL